MMQCPKCQTDLSAPERIQDLSVDRCPSCGGIWFDDQELIPLLHENLKALASLRTGSDTHDQNSKRGQCPRDATELLRVYSSFSKLVVLDSCPQCHGIWLDGGEFEELLKVARSA